MRLIHNFAHLPEMISASLNNFGVEKIFYEKAAAGDVWTRRKLGLEWKSPFAARGACIFCFSHSSQRRRRFYLKIQNLAEEAIF